MQFKSRIIIFYIISPKFFDEIFAFPKEKKSLLIKCFQLRSLPVRNSAKNVLYRPRVYIDSFLGVELSEESCKGSKFTDVHSVPP